jgi:GGDEF domain-containing protein
VQKLGLPELTSEQIEQLCLIAEAAARKHILSKVPSKKIETLNISAEAEGLKPLRLTVDIEIVLSPRAESLNAKKLADEAVKEAFASAEKYLRELTCHSPK